tara:strand:+ start:53 stop:646 length:594 start_codon:yes stop_codon:yes gene_type:complete
MAIINVALSDTFDQWRTKTNTLGTNQGDLASLDAGFAGSDLVSCLNELRAGEEFTKIDIADSTNAAGDGPSIRIGDGDDLLLYHDGGSSKISNTTGILQILGDQIGLYSAGGENMLFATGDGSVQLYHDNVKKFETSANGVNVTGDVDITGTATAATFSGSGASLTGIVSSTFSSPVTLNIKNSSGTVLKTLRSPGS